MLQASVHRPGDDALEGLGSVVALLQIAVFVVPLAIARSGVAQLAGCQLAAAVEDEDLLVGIELAGVADPGGHAPFAVSVDELLVAALLRQEGEPAGFLRAVSPRD